MRALTLLMLLCALGARLSAQSVNKAKLDSFLSVLSSHNKAMGSVAIAKKGIIVYQRSMGYANIDAQQQADANTRYHIGSVSKMFTSVMVFQLIEEQKLQLSTPLSDFFPQIPNAKQITIKLLLSHRSGLYDYVNDTNSLEWVTTAQTKEAIIASIVKGKPHALPDTKFIYCNSGYFLLASIIEAVTKGSYDDNLQSRICGRIGLTHTYSPTDNQLKNNEAYPYRLVSGKWDVVKDLYFPNVVGVGDILSTPGDLVVFNECLLTGKLINKASLASMKTFADDEGMGIMKMHFAGKTGLGHSGDTFGSHSLTALFPSDSLTLAACINAADYPLNDIYAGLLSICADIDFTIPTFKTITLSGETIAKYKGTYSSKDLPLQIVITTKGTTLYAQATGQDELALDATDENKFQYDKAGIQLEFHTDKNEMVLKQGGGTFLFKRGE